MAPPNPSFSFLTSGIASFAMNFEFLTVVSLPLMNTAPPSMFATFLLNSELIISTLFASILTAPPYSDA